MGSTFLHKSGNSQFRLNDVSNVIYNGLARSLDGAFRKGLKVAESKLLLFVLTIIGIPAYIYAYFLDVHGNLEIWKGVILTAIGAFTGIVIGCRQLVKFLSEWKEYRKKYYNKK